jgi:hypothetical protein
MMEIRRIVQGGNARVPATVCPKCGFRQEEGEECLRCGIVFKRYRGNTPWPPARTSWAEAAPERPGRLRRWYRVFRWATLIALVLVVILILYPSTPPAIEISADATRRAETKVLKFQTSVNRGREDTLEMDESELNGWLGTNLSLSNPSGGAGSPAAAGHASPIALAKKALAAQTPSDPNLEQVKSSVRDVRIELLEDSLRAYVLFDLYGKEMSLEMEGRITVRDGCLRLVPTGGKLGSLPLWGGTLEQAAKRLFDAPENRDKFRLPLNVSDIRIEQGRLIVTTR